MQPVVLMHTTTVHDKAVQGQLTTVTANRHGENLNEMPYRGMPETALAQVEQ
jgi:hypothetical protein